MAMFEKWVDDVPDPTQQGNKPPPPPPKPKPLPKGATPPAPPKRKVKHVVAWPANLATVRESEAYFEERDGSTYYGKVAAEYPNLLIIVLATYIDHLYLLTSLHLLL